LWERWQGGEEGTRDKGQGTRPLLEPPIHHTPPDQQWHRHECGADPERGLPRAGQHHADLVAERVVVHEIGPRRRRTFEDGIRKHDVAVLEGQRVERLEHGCVDVRVDLTETDGKVGRESCQGILAAECRQVDAFAQVGGVGQVVAPRAIDAPQRRQPFGLADVRLSGAGDQRGVPLGIRSPHVGLVAFLEQRGATFHQRRALILEDL
jgi:hypothetical protein